jgi:hypothetical protein
MTNNNNNRRNNRSNPVSYNARLMSAAQSSQIYNGKDIIVTDFTGTATFGASDYSLNPRLSDKFPAASKSAQRYDMYQFEELMFRYHPTTAVTNTPGVIFLAWEPNPNRGPPDSVAQINAFQYHSEAPIYNPNLQLRIPKGALGGPRFTRAGPTSSDLSLYDCGRLIVASDDVTGSEGGYVEVSYKIRFFNYHLEEADPIQNRAAEVCLITTPQSCATGVATVLVFNSLKEDFNGDDTTDLTAGSLKLPKGKYFVCGVIQTWDDTSETFTSACEIKKNGASLSPKYEVQWKTGATGTTEYHSVPLSTVVESDGDDLFTVVVTLTGAAGNLTISKDATRVCFYALS